MARKATLLAAKPDEHGTTVLRAPEVGHFTGALERGGVLVEGTKAGWITTLDETVELVVPQGVAGWIRSEPPALVRQPVGYGDRLYELTPIDDIRASTSRDDVPSDSTGALLFRAPHSGRFWHRPSPQDPAFVEIGSILSAGSTVGLIEVMKAFTRLEYSPGDALPKRARITRIAVADGDEVTEGDALLEIEPA